MQDATRFHLSELLKRPVVDRHGQPLGRLADVIVRLRGAEYPVVTGTLRINPSPRSRTQPREAEQADGKRDDSANDIAKVSR
jgi:sporulation protein YlmC with PRC-barrel domain